MALKEGLSAIHNQNVLRVVIESDSSQAMNLVLDFPDKYHPMLYFILECQCPHRVARLLMFLGTIMFIPTV